MVILSCSFFSIMHFVFTTSYTGISLCFFISDIFISDIFISGIFISGILCVKFQIILLLCSFKKKVHVNLYPIKFCVLCIQSNFVYFVSNQILCTLTNAFIPCSSLWMQRNPLKKSPYFPPPLTSTLRRSDTASRRHSTQPIDSQTDSVSLTHRWWTGSQTLPSIKPPQSKT